MTGIGRWVGVLVLTPWLAAAQGPPGQGEAPGPLREGYQAAPHRGAFRGELPPPMRRGGLWGRAAWWKDAEVVRDLALTPAQVEQLERSAYDHRLKLIDLRADVERQRLRLRPLLDAERPDEAKVTAQLDQVIAARGRLQKANILHRLAVRRVLDAQQWSKLQARRQERRALGPGRWGGPGGPRRDRGFRGGPDPWGGGAPPPPPPKE